MDSSDDGVTEKRQYTYAPNAENPRPRKIVRNVNAGSSGWSLTDKTYRRRL